MIGAFIRKQRETKQITQEELVKILNIGRQTLARIEQGSSDLSYKQLQLIAQRFDMDIADLIQEKPAKAIEVKLLKENKPAKRKNTPPMRISVPQKKVDKFKEVLLYILEKVGGALMWVKQYYTSSYISLILIIMNCMKNNLLAQPIKKITMAQRR